MRVFLGFSFAVAALVGVLACDKSTTDASPGGGTTAELEVCDPLLVAPEPIKLRTVLAAGRAADGTIWLLDHNGPRPDVVTDERLFKSNGNVLQRVNVSGSGSSSDFCTVTFAEGQVRIEIANGLATRMGKTSSVAMDPKTKSFEIDASNELTLVGADVYGSMSVANIAEQSLYYDATTPDGHRFVAMRPVIDYSADDIRVFYGTDERLLQRRVKSFGQAMSGGGSIVFDLEGVETTASLYFGGRFAGPGGPSQLTSATGSVRLTAVEGSPGYGADQYSASDYNSYSDASSPPNPPQKTAAELTAGLTFVCF